MVVGENMYMITTTDIIVYVLVMIIKVHSMFLTKKIVIVLDCIYMYVFVQFLFFVFCSCLFIRSFFRLFFRFFLLRLHR